MSGKQKRPDAYQTRRFSKALDSLGEDDQVIIEDAIEEIIADPLIGDQKKGALKYLRVHKVKVRETQYLIGYNWDAGKLALNLLQLGPHENYYRDAEKRRKSDLRFIE